VGGAPFKKVTLTRPNALAFGEIWRSKSLPPILASVGIQAIEGPFIKRGDKITNLAWAIFDEGGGFTCYAPAVQGVLGNLQMGGCIFNGQKCVGIHVFHPLSGSTSIANLRSRKTKRTQKNQTNPACPPKSRSPTTRTYPPDIHRWIDLFRRVPARTSLAKYDPQSPNAIMLEIGESKGTVRVRPPNQLQKDSAPNQKSTDPSGDPV
jgi:hypothetical protein